ncbi:MAG: itaconate CoA-transferase [Parasphingorhabdus sp.]|jgi:itaconate CoA-transferase
MTPGKELQGINVVSIDQAVAAPYCSLLLADAGARVIKVERPEGDFARGYDRGANGNSVIFAWLNRGKESISVDLNQQQDVALLHKMLSTADVFVHNLAPGALAKRGFSGDALRADNPGLISCEISGYGNQGSAASKKAYDFLVQAESGLCSVTGTDDSPSRVGISICDISSGLTAFSAILRALIGRGITGEGSDIAISMFDVMADWMNMPLLSSRYMGGAPGRLGLTHALIAPYGAFECGCGSQILIAIQSNREWAIFCDQVLKQAELGQDIRFKDNTDRVANRPALHAIVNDTFSRYDQSQLVALLDRAKIANARLSDVDDLSSHEFLNNITIQFGDMSIELADLPVPGARPVEVPLLNQHGDAIRLEYS